MENSIQHEHEWFAEQVGAYLSGGLEGEDRARFDAHAAACASCAAALAEAASADAGLRRLFHDVRPDEGFETRVIQQLRQGNFRGSWTIHPLVMRAAGTAAAAILLAAIGYGGNRLIEHGTLQRMVDARLSRPMTPGNHAKVEAFAMTGPFIGAQRDKSYDGDVTRGGKMLQSPQIANDSVLLPTDDEEGTVAPPAQADKLSEAMAARTKTVGDLINLSRTQISQNNYTAAAGVLDQIKVLDPKNDYAHGVEQFVQDRAVIQDHRKDHESFFRNIKDRTNIIIHSEEDTKVPNDILHYSDKWADITEGRRGEIGIKDVSKVGEDAKFQLNRTLPKVSLDQMSLGDAVNSLSDASGSNIVVNWKALEAAGIDKSSTKVSANLHDVKFSQALKAVLDQAGDGKLAYTTDDGIITVSSTEDLNKNVVTKVYNIQDLLANSTFNPTVDLSSYGQALSQTANSGTSSGATGGTSMFGSSGSSTQTPESAAREQQLQDIARKIQNTVAFNTWKSNDPNGTGQIDDFNNQLIITATPENQGEISEFLDKIRESGGMGPGVPATYFKPGEIALGIAGGTDFSSDGTVAGNTEKLEDAQEKSPQTGLTGGGGNTNGGFTNGTPPPASVAIDHSIVALNPAAPTAGDGPSTPPAAPAKPGESTPPPAPVQAAPPPVESTRKIIRHGEMTFEVDGFDSAALEIAKIVAEERGFVATTSSEKLPNGKVTGTISVRVPPDHLDTLVLKLRGLGDLKGQKIAADDVTKEYTDMESELRAAQAMQERMLDIIKTGKGEVKDLVAAEKELGVWREKVEVVTGEINYYNNLISLSTLEITLSERDIRQAALATEVETVNLGIETENVAKAREDALKAIDDAKGRIIQSNMKQFEAGQLAAQIIAEVPPDASGPVIDRLTQLGRVARRDVNRQQSTANGAPVAAGVKVERKDTQFSISLYNLANIAPRETANLTLASNDVETTYKTAIDRVIKAGGRVIDSSLNKPKSDQVAAAINFETPEDKADGVLAELQAMGEVLHLTETENPDAANVTASKRGFVMTLSSLATIPPREVITRTVMPNGSVVEAYHALLSAAQTAGGGISTSQLQESGSQGAAGQLVFDVPRAKLADIEKVVEGISAGGKIISRQSTKSSDTEHTVDSKVGLAFSLVSSDALAPRLTSSMTLAVQDVPGTYRAILSAAELKGAKIATANLDEAERQNIVGLLDLVVPREGLEAVEKAIGDAKGGVVSRDDRRSPDPDTTTDAKISLLLTIKDIEQIPPRQTTTLGMQVADPEKSQGDLCAAALKAGGRVVSQRMGKDPNGNLATHVVMDVPLPAAQQIIDQARGMGTVRNIDQAKDPNIPEADFTRARIEVTLASETPMVGDETGLWATLKSGVGTSIKGLLYSLELIIIGLCLLVPWAGLLWLGFKGYRRVKPKAVV